MLILDESASDYNLNVSLIPRSSQQNCPAYSGFRERFGVCTCNEHCSWDLCRNLLPPNKCLAGTGSVWVWDHLKHAWVAQINDGNQAYFKTNYLFDYKNNTQKYLYLGITVSIFQCSSKYNGSYHCVGRKE